VVADPGLSLSDLAAVQEQVSALLAGLSAPPPAEEPPRGEPQPVMENPVAGEPGDAP